MPPISPVLRNYSLLTALPPLSPPKPAEATPEPNLHHETAFIKAASPSSPTYRTLTISLPRTTYATVVLLGASSPSTFFALDPSPSPSLVLSSSTAERRQTAAGEISGSPNLGIIIGCIAGFGLLLGVVYVWILRARQRKRGREKRAKTKTKKGENGDKVEKVEKPEKPKAKKSVKKKKKRMRRMRRMRRKSVGSAKSSQAPESPVPAPAEPAPAPDAPAAA